MYMFGDTSGGADTASPALRRVGVSSAAFHSLSINGMHLEMAMWGAPAWRQADGGPRRAAGHAPGHPGFRP
eukprot:2112581-Pyramimonas_sp.AAC.1